MTNAGLKRSVIFNAVLAVMELTGLIISLALYGIAQFRYFTEDINLISFAASTLYCIYGIRSLKNNRELPKAVRVFRSITAVNLLMVFFVTLTGGIVGYDGLTFGYIMFADCSLLFHTLCPIVSTVTALLFEKAGITTYRGSLIALVLPALYSVIIIPLNILRAVHGPYTYLYVYEVPVSTVAGAVACIFLLTFAISLAFVLIKRSTGCDIGK